MSKNRRKVIIEVYDEEIQDSTAVDLVSHVIAMGKVSKEKDENVYCHLTVFDVAGREVDVVRSYYTRPGLVKFTIHGPQAVGESDNG